MNMYISHIKQITKIEKKKTERRFWCVGEC